MDQTTPASRTAIKLCGLRTPEDVEVAASLGVWAVGFVLTESPRQIDAERCRELAARVPEGILRIGVFTDEPPETVARLLEQCGLDAAQLHGPHPPETWARFPRGRVFRAFRVRGPESLEELEAVRGETFVLDAYVEGLAGGSGVSFDWPLARAAKRYGRVVLAGGLTPDSVGRAIREAAPWGVDVSSGIESAKGVKDHARMRAFVEAVCAAAP